MTVKFAPEYTRLKKGSGGRLKRPPVKQQKSWLPSNFKLEIDKPRLHEGEQGRRVHRETGRRRRRDRRGARLRQGAVAGSTSRTSRHARRVVGADVDGLVRRLRRQGQQRSRAGAERQAHLPLADLQDRSARSASSTSASSASSGSRGPRAARRRSRACTAGPLLRADGAEGRPLEELTSPGRRTGRPGARRLSALLDRDVRVRGRRRELVERPLASRSCS